MSVGDGRLGRSGQNAGMPVDQALLDLMRREVARQSQYALIAAEGIEHWLLRYDPGDPTYAWVGQQDAEDRLWSSVQSFLGGRRRWSRSCWGAGEAGSAVRRSLRKGFGVSDDSLLRDRELRNTSSTSMSDLKRSSPTCQTIHLSMPTWVRSSTAPGPSSRGRKSFQ